MRSPAFPAIAPAWSPKATPTIRLCSNSSPPAPPLLAMVSGPNLDWRCTVAIVGARNAFAAGIKMTRLPANEFGRVSYTIVLGLARGIDAAAYQAVLSTGTVAVLAGDCDKIYLKQNIPLTMIFSISAAPRSLKCHWDESLALATFRATIG